MSLTATYDSTNAKVTLVIASAPSGATAAHLERSTDQITWTDVRGGQALTVSAGAATLIDYEYAAGVANFYRATYNATPTFVAAGTAATGTGSLTPGLPAGMAVGDLMVLVVSIVGATVNTPTGWTSLLLDSSDLGYRVFQRLHQTGDTAPTITFTGSNSGSIAQISAFRGMNESGIQVAKQRNTSFSQTVLYPGLTAASAGAALIAGWLFNSSGTTVATPSGFTQIGKTVLSSQVIFWFYKLGVTKGAAIGPGSIVTTGGSGGTFSDTAVLALPSGGQDTASVTPAQDVVWLKNPLRPFLNRPVTVTGIGDVTRDSRSGLFDIIARTPAVAVTDLMSGRTVPLTLRATDPAHAVDIDDMVAVGEVLYVQSPVNSPVPTLYALPAGSTVQRVANTSSARNLPLSLTECAMPDLSLAAVQSTCQTVLNTYATCADLVLAKATCADVLLLVGTAEDVITD